MSFESHVSTNSAAALPPLERRLIAALGRFAGGLLLLVVAALWLSVMTWSVNDPSLTHATSGTPRNLMGALGAIVSDLLLQTLGLATLIVLIVPLFWGLEMLKSSGPDAGIKKSQFFWLPVAAVTVAGAFSALPVMASWPLHHALGGIVGDTVFAISAKLFQLINTARGGVAAGLVLALVAAAATGRATGLAWADVLAALQPGKVRSHTAGQERASLDHAIAGETVRHYSDPAGRIEPQLMMPPNALGGARVHGMASDPSISDAQDHPQSEHPTGMPLSARFARVMAGARGVAQRSVAVAHHHATRLGASIPGAGADDGHGAGGSASARGLRRQGYSARADGGAHGEWPANAPSSGQASGHITGAGPAGLRPAHGHQAAPHGQPYGFTPPQNDGALPYRDADFDMTTEESSRAIAARFAPSGVAVAHVQEEPVGFAPVPAAPTPAMAAHHQALMEPKAAVVPAHPAASAGSAQMAGAVPPNAGVPPPKSDSIAAAQTLANATPRSAKRNALFGGLTFRHQAQAGTKLPSINLLKKPAPGKAGPEFTQTMLRGNARLLEDVLADFGVKGEIRDIRPGPVVTLFEFEPARGVKSSRVIGLAEDIARSMSAISARVAVVPGRNAIGIELPNSRRDPVLLREVLESDSYKSLDSALPIALGKSIGGEPVVADLARMPHLLVAGTTGSGKSVGVNAMIVSMLYRMSPDDCRFLMIDPKMLELSVYNGIPHLLAPVVTDPHKAVTALNWVVGEMEERYKRMSKLSVRNIDVYNNRVRNAKKRGEMISRTVQTGFDRRTGEAVYEQEQMQLDTMPFIVVVIDEFADLMMVAGKEVEASVQRLAQMARAAGIHIIMATQRPSVDVITGTIKANFPTRISFKVTSKIDSRTILNEQGAEQLLGQGDMLFAAGSGQAGRVHGAFVADEEVEAITDFLRAQGAPRYVEGITDAPEEASSDAQLPQGQGEEDLYDRAVAIVLRDRKASTSYLQRRLSIGYNRAADLIERMEAEGLIGAANHAGKREILAQTGGAHGDGAADAA